jgi:hypothetical protein
VRDLAAQSPLEVDQCLPGGAEVVVLVPYPGRRLRHGPAQGLVEQADLVIACGEAVAQLALLCFELRRQTGIVLLELAQPADIGAIGGSDHVGEHVHVAERLTHDGVGRRRMAQHRPIGAGNVAALDGVFPQPAQRILFPRRSKLLDRRFVAAVERLLDQLAAAMPGRVFSHPPLVQIVVAAACRRRGRELDHQPAQFRALKAGADG